MNILFVTPPPYLPNTLHRIRSYHLIKLLSKKHNVHLLCVTTEKKDSHDFTKIKKLAKSVTVVRMSFFQGITNCILAPNLPYEVAFCKNKYASEALKRILNEKNIDLLYLKRLRSAVYINIEKANLPILFDTTDAMSLFYDRLSKHSPFPKNIFYTYQSFVYKRFEKQTAKKIKHWIVCSDEDKNYLRKVISNTISVIPNVTNIPKHQKLRQNIKNKPPILIFQGLMDKPVNIDGATYFVTHIFPRIKRKNKHVLLYIVGPKPPKQITSLQNKHIKVTGFVRDSNVMYKKSSVAINPIRIGSGTRNKILNAWKNYRPVVSTTLGAEGLKTIHRKNICIADTPEDFANEVINLLSNQKQYDTIAKNGLITAREHYSPSTMEKALQLLLKHETKTNT